MKKKKQNKKTLGNPALIAAMAMKQNTPAAPQTGRTQYDVAYEEGKQKRNKNILLAFGIGVGVLGLVFVGKRIYDKNKLKNIDKMELTPVVTTLNKLIHLSWRDYLQFSRWTNAGDIIEIFKKHPDIQAIKELYLKKYNITLLDDLQNNFDEGEFQSFVPYLTGEAQKNEQKGQKASEDGIIDLDKLRKAK